MATNMIYKYTEGRVRSRALADLVAPAAPSTLASGVPVLTTEGPAVSLTASGNSTVTTTGASNLPPGVTSITVNNGGVGNAAGSAAFAFDGSFDFAVTGATTSTKSGVEVYITTAGGLTLTEGTNTAYGFTDYPNDYNKVAGRAVVRIGA